MTEVKNEAMTLWEQWEEDQLIRNGASLALFAILSFVPLWILVTIVLQVFNVDISSTEIFSALTSVMGQNNAQSLSSSLSSNAQSGWTVGIISIISLLLAVYALARQARDILNEIFHVDRDEPFEDEMKRNLIALGMVLLVGFIMIVTVSLILYVSSLEQLSGNANILAQVGNFIGVSLLVAYLFALVYKTIPDVDMRWRDLITGTLISGVLFTVGAFVVTWYINSSASIQSSTNVFGSAIVAIIWALYASVVMLFGAELVQHNARRNGRRIQPDY